MRLSIVAFGLSIGWHGQAQRRHAQVANRCFLTVGILLFVVSGGCRDRKAPEAPPAAPPLTRTATDGPVTVTLTVSPGELAFTERAEVLVEVTAEKSAAVGVQEYDRAAEHLAHQYEYRLSRGERRPAVPTPDGRLRWSYRYSLQFFLPGDYELPPAMASYTEAASSSTAEGEPDAPPARQVRTEPITVTARDPSAKTLSDEELRQISIPQPVELPGAWSRWWWAFPIAAAGIIACTWLLRRRGAWTPMEPAIPAHEWARRQFATLVADDLIAKGWIQEFYYRISAIVRGYIERRFGVSAPEMTTEEFLVAAAEDGRFGREHTASLQGFMTACDLVKYARQIPQSSEAGEALRAAETFVEKTREDRQAIASTASPLGELHAA